MSHVPPLAIPKLRVLTLVDDILRGRGEQLRQDNTKGLVIRTLLVMAACGCAYGAVMGSYSESLLEIRPLQVLYSAIKVPVLLFATFCLSLPSFYVANVILGLQPEFGRALRALITTQAALTILLFGLAPFTFFAYVCGAAYDQSLAINTIMFGLASISVQVLLRRLYRPLIATNHRHRWMIRAWLVIYAFVGIQMGWVMRPFVGDPSAPTTFLREDAWSNAYLVVVELFARLLFGKG